MNIDEYFEKYGREVAAKTDAMFSPLHTPGTDPVVDTMHLKRTLLPAQSHTATGIVRAWQHHKCVMMCGTMGVGKTITAIAAADAAGGPIYRALVMCPDHLVDKWVDEEIKTTVPGAKVTAIDDWKQFALLRKVNRYFKPDSPEWYVLGRNKAKLSCGWRPSYIKRRGIPCCPECFAPLKRKVNEKGESVWWSHKELASTKRTCEVCESPLWQYYRRWDRWAPAQYIHSHLRNVFDFLVLDEAHETKSANSLQGRAAGSLIAAARKVITLTGTLIGGQANHLHPTLFRVRPQPLIDEGHTWSGQLGFSREYGRVDTVVTTKAPCSGGTLANGRGSKESTRQEIRPGIMPTLYGRHLIDSTLFLTLDDVSDNLPSLDERPISVPMSEPQAAEYARIEQALGSAVKELLRKGSRKLLSTMLQTLLAWPDHPYNWKELGYYDSDHHWQAVVTPQNLPDNRYHPKESALLDIIRQENELGRQVWVFVDFTQEHDVGYRLERLIANHYYKVKYLRDSDCKLRDRAKWIDRHGPDTEVMISHPKLVETGLDLFDKGGSYNFPTLIFTGACNYNLFTMRQASRRAYRISQRDDCKVYYTYYADTMQARAINRMAEKMQASMALEGQLSSEGLSCLASDTEDTAMQLARDLAEGVDFGDAGRCWKKATR